MVTTPFWLTGPRIPAKPGRNRLLTLILVVSGLTPVARAIAVAMIACRTLEVSVPVRPAIASVARYAAGELNRPCQYRRPCRPSGCVGAPNVSGGADRSFFSQ